jgi:5-oxoprolinase (ATP-hydrolysing) subunit A
VGVPELLGPPDSALERKTREAGLVFVAEAFADRSYETDGSLTPRALPGAVMTDEAMQLAQAVSIVEAGEVIARTGERVRVQAQTICLHGDTPGAAGSALALKRALVARGIEIAV